MLYSALTKNDIIHGIEKLSNSFEIFSFHKNASLFSIFFNSNNLVETSGIYVKHILIQG